MPDPSTPGCFLEMRETARSIFRYTLDQASIANAFARHVNCERGLLRVRDDLYDLQSYSGVLVVSLGKAANTMLEALARQVGSSLSGIVAASVESASQLRGFRYFRGGHPTPNQESIQAATAMLRAFNVESIEPMNVFGEAEYSVSLSS